MEKYSCGHCIEFSGIFDTINDDKLENTIIEACKDNNINVSETDIEACHRLPVRCNATNVSKRVIVKLWFRNMQNLFCQKSLPWALQTFLDLM